MSLLQQIKNDQLSARKARDAVKATLLTTLIGEASIVGKNDGGRETNDPEVIAVVKKFIKNTNEVLKVLGPIEGGPTTVPLAELAILNTYLPKQLSEDDIEDALDVIIIDLSTSGNKPKMGDVLKQLKAQFEGQYDGAAASKIAKQLLA